ncbi:MAG: carbon-nitrogen hydrolase family protein, partial [Lachnospiraceae bacterium]|nr:carbon-nitrogen hydrolase family protein [Candidatus Equihabitans merdae]
TFKESDTLSAGNEVVVFDTSFGKVAICICYDVRFPELIRLMALKGAGMVLVPAAFNHTTGPLHWELAFRSQAMYNQVFMVGTSSALDESASYHSWGHTMLADPWGRVVQQMGKEEGYIISEIDLSMLDQVREQIPLLKHRRTDIYSLDLKK